MSFNKHDVLSILSEDHRRNTAHALGKSATDVTADDLVSHWLRHHIQMTVVSFDVHNHLEQHVPNPDFLSKYAGAD